MKPTLLPAPLTRRTLLSFPILQAAARAAVSGTAAVRESRFSREDVLGTSMDLVVFAAPGRQAAAAEKEVLDEVARLCSVLSVYDPSSEISRVNAGQCASPLSSDLRRVLAAYERWESRTSGVISARLGRTIAAWKAADGSPCAPSAGEPATGACLLNIDALGKAYVIGRAMAALRRSVPGLEGAMLNIGGDIVLSGAAGPVRRQPWTIGVANPAEWFDNAPPLTTLLLEEGAVATSGGYERGRRTGGRTYSHILDPRTGRPAEGAAGATVIAPDIVTANALATALCILSPREGLRLVASEPGCECLIVQPDGGEVRSAGFARYEQPRIVRAVAAANWPAGYEVAVTLTLKAIETSGASSNAASGQSGAEGKGSAPQGVARQQGGDGGFGGWAKPGGEGPGRGRGGHGARGGYRRPFVAVWVEDGQGRVVRTVALWANSPKWLPDLHGWWAKNKTKGAQGAFAMSRATRPPGRYRLVWDGLDDGGKPVPAGTYSIQVEVTREFGTYAKQGGTIVCAERVAKTTLTATPEFEEVAVEYGPRPKNA